MKSVQKYRSVKISNISERTYFRLIKRADSFTLKKDEINYAIKLPSVMDLRQLTMINNFLQNGIQEILNKYREDLIKDMSIMDIEQLGKLLFSLSNRIKKIIALKT